MTTVRTLIANIKGPKGDKGDKGDTGNTGAIGPAGPPGTVDKDTPVEFTQGTQYTLPASGEAFGSIIGKTTGDIAILKSGLDSAYVLDRINPITAGSLNDYITPGIYNARNSDIAKNITDLPGGYSNTGFKLIVECIGHSNMILQTIIYQTSLLNMYKRLRDNGTWSGWYGGPNNHWNAIGLLANLQTTEKSSLVGAINELKSDIGSLQTRIAATAPTKTVWQDQGADLNLYIDKGLDRTMLMICASDGTVSYYPVTWTAATSSMQSLTEIKLGSRSQSVGYVKDVSEGRYRIKIASNTSVSRGITAMICDTSAVFV